jgi:nucleotide-binding universal stress UspA family protein
MTELYEAIEVDAKMMLAGKKKRLVSSLSGLIVETTVLHGKPADKIINYAKNEKIDVIIIGSKGRGSRLSRLTNTLDSVSRAVSESASCPVIIVP